MEQLNLSFWLGLAAAVPLSILGNLLTPKAQQWAAKQNSKKAAKRISELRSELAAVERLVNEPAQLQTFLLESVLLITLMTSSFGMISGTFFVLENISPISSRALSSMGQLVAIVGAVAVFKECLETLRRSQRAKQFSVYKEKVALEVAELEKAGA